MERDEFLRKCSLVCLSGLGISFLLPGCSPAYYIPFVVEGNRVKVKKADFVEVKKEKLLEHNWVLVKTERYEEPIYLRKLENNDYSAVLLHCQHKGCEVNPAADMLHCPCHGSEYTTTGKVVKGPSEKDLQQFMVQADGDYLYIQL
ncbi:QcrA and Rieske domain-containing protein [Adhaeribacter aerolatus]|uniref:QcrA and Rieske domain-containing protein n=1 Tax=Adhaeribacter aerolatus TaxID=670289 RepID=UPI0011BE884B|nr:ubiquinol-cytochrome c reductase iron-sulfur subunit [Adhaeribacter aerolatus]